MAKKARVYEVKLISIKRPLEVFRWAADSEYDLRRQLSHESDRKVEIKYLGFFQFHTMPSQETNGVAFRCDACNITVELGHIGYDYLNRYFSRQASEVQSFLNEQDN